MRLLVTGGSGFLGGYVLDEAAQRGHEVVALARSDAAAEAVGARGATPLTGDLDDPAQLADVFATADCEVLVNLASLGFGHAPAIVARRPVSRAGAGRLPLHYRGDHDPPGTQQAGPAGGRAAVRNSGLTWTILRPTMIYGAAGDRNLSRLLRVLTRTRVLPVPGGGKHLQQPVHVADLAGAVLTATERTANVGSCYDVAGPEPITFAALLRTAARAVGSRTRFVPVPLAPVIAAVRWYETLSPAPRLRAEQLQRLAEDKSFRIDEAARDLDYAPRSFDEGIQAEAAALGLAAPGGAARRPSAQRPSAHGRADGRAS